MRVWVCSMFANSTKKPVMSPRVRAEQRAVAKNKTDPLWFLPLSLLDTVSARKNGRMELWEEGVEDEHLHTASLMYTDLRGLNRKLALKTVSTFFPSIVTYMGYHSGQITWNKKLQSYE